MLLKECTDCKLCGMLVLPHKGDTHTAISLPVKHCFLKFSDGIKWCFLVPSGSSISDFPNFFLLLFTAEIPLVFYLNNVQTSLSRHSQDEKKMTS